MNEFDQKAAQWDAKLVRVERAGDGCGHPGGRAFIAGYDGAGIWLRHGVGEF